MDAEKYLSVPQVVGGLVLGSAAAWFGQVWPLMAFVAAAIVMDYISGMVAAGKNREINSQKAREGIWKKAGFLLLMCMGFFLDACVTWLIINGLKLDMPVNLPFGLIICAWIIFTEAISFLENLHRIGITVPDGILKFLKVAKDKVEKNGE